MNGEIEFLGPQGESYYYPTAFSLEGEQQSSHKSLRQKIAEAFAQRASAGSCVDLAENAYRRAVRPHNLLGLSGFTWGNNLVMVDKSGEISIQSLAHPDTSVCSRTIEDTARFSAEGVSRVSVRR